MKQILVKLACLKFMGRCSKEDKSILIYDVGGVPQGLVLFSIVFYLIFLYLCFIAQLQIYLRFLNYF